MTTQLNKKKSLLSVSMSEEDCVYRAHVLKLRVFLNLHIFCYGIFILRGCELESIRIK